MFLIKANGECVLLIRILLPSEKLTAKSMVKRLIDVVIG